MCICPLSRPQVSTGTSLPTFSPSLCPSPLVFSFGPEEWTGYPVVKRGSPRRPKPFTSPSVLTRGLTGLGRWTTVVDPV